MSDFNLLFFVSWTFPLEIFVPKREKNVPWHDQHFMSFLQNEILISWSNFYKYFILMESYISKGTQFYPMPSDFHCTSLELFVPNCCKIFVGFCCNIFMDHVMPDVWWGTPLLTTITTPASSLCYLHNRGDTSCFDFQQVSKLCLEVGRFNPCEFSEPHSPHGARHSSGHAAVASTSWGSVHHTGPHSELRTNFPLSCFFEVLLEHGPHRPRVGWHSVQLLFGSK